MTQRCARCRREAPDQLSEELLTWEALDETGDEVICPGCLTGAEGQAIYEDTALAQLEVDVETPTLGLQGDYSDTCVACLRPTDTGICLEGEAEWILAVLTVLGLEADEALQMLARTDARFQPVGMVPDGRIEVALRVCGDCAKRVRGLPVGLITSAGMPGISQP